MTVDRDEAQRILSGGKTRGCPKYDLAATVIAQADEIAAKDAEIDTLLSIIERYRTNWYTHFDPEPVWWRLQPLAVGAAWEPITEPMTPAQAEFFARRDGAALDKGDKEPNDG